MADEPESEGLEAEVAPEDDLKRKFREALERKRTSQAEANAQGSGKGKSKVYGAQGPAAHRRSFRRKSG